MTNFLSSQKLLIGLENKATFLKENNTFDSIRPSDFASMTLDPKQFQKFNHQFPCIDKSSKQKEGGVGFHYIKVHKTASSTVAHIVKYISNRRGRCLEYSNHAPAHEFQGLLNRARNQNNSYLFTFVREPTKRAVSDFFYRKVTQDREEVNLENFQNGCCRSKQGLNGQAGYQLAYISTDEKLPEYTFWNDSDPNKVQNPKLLLRRINNVFDTYDFIGVSERLNESLVVLSFLLDLSITEIVYVSYRQSGSYLEINKRCIKIVESHVTSDIEDYVETEEWKAKTAGDKLLHETVMAALDNTIDNVIGREMFQARLKEYEALLKSMAKCETVCSSSCTNTGEYRGAISCRPCMNQVRKEWEDGMVMNIA